ncbi:hypothetical protein ACFVW8_14855 [Streptomyces sp. NPDC058221]|uniref:hypothetical protein n=1 Tax=Streptomyces sp. NPDC058221 TaxID=3346388 RepID=UPI0036EBBBA0
MTGPHLGARPAAWAAAIVLSVTGSGLVGGGVAHAEDIDTLTAQQIADRSRDALLGAHSMHLRTKGDLGRGRTPMSVDLTLDRDDNCTGSVDLGNSQGSVRIVKRGDEVWIKPDADFWKNQVPDGGQAFAAILNGRYMKASADDPRLLTLTKACDLDTFQKLVSDNADNDHGTLNKAARTTLGKAPVVPLTRMRGETTLRLYVAATGKPYPLRLTVQGGGADATVDFSAFDKPVPTSTPPPDDTFDINALLGRSTGTV